MTSETNETKVKKQQRNTMSNNYDKIPARTKNAIDYHAEHGWPVGDFVQAVLENNLVEAFKRADDENLAAMQEIVKYCYNEIPGGAWGSPAKFMAHLDKKEQEAKGLEA